MSAAITRRELLGGGLALAGASLLRPARATAAHFCGLYGHKPTLEDATPIDVAGRLAEVVGGFRPPPGY